MNEGIGEIDRLLHEVAEHLKTGDTADARKAVTKLERIAALAATLELRQLYARPAESRSVSALLPVLRRHALSTDGTEARKLANAAAPRRSRR